MFVPCNELGNMTTRAAKIIEAYYTAREETEFDLMVMGTAFEDFQNGLETYEGYKYRVANWEESKAREEGLAIAIALLEDLNGMAEEPDYFAISLWELCNFQRNHVAASVLRWAAELFNSREWDN
jgi:hypothetical protein